MPVNPEYIQRQIDEVDTELKHLQDRKRELEEQRNQAAATMAVSHEEAVLKLREIYRDARTTDNERDFIFSVHQDKDLSKWFPDIANILQ